MSDHSITNLPASVRQRLLNVSRINKEPFDRILSRYAVERLLYRLSRSTYRDRFFLKGAMLFTLWFEEMHRPTRDVDLLGHGDDDEPALERIFAELCDLEVEPDGLVFHGDSVKAERIRESAAYTGIRVTLLTTLESAKAHVQVDVGFGDHVTPDAENVTFPTLLDFDAPKLRAYPVYTVVAEKLEAMVSLGETNTRMKDFFDLWFLSRHTDFDGAILSEAIRVTFMRRHTQLPVGIPLPLSDTFAEANSTQWRSFLNKNSMAQTPFAQVIGELREFIVPIFLSKDSESKHWKPDTRWY